MKFNNKNTTTNKTINKAGGEAYVQSPKLAFISLLLTSFVKNQYYRSGNETLQELKDYISQIKDKEFLAKAAIFARTKYGMRSISHAVAGEIANSVKGEEWTKRFFDKIIYRPDDMMEILSYYYGLGNKNEPNALIKGFREAIQRFDEYQLAKYKKDGAEVSLIDVVNLVHPKANPALNKLMTGKLESPETWETELTKAGQVAETDEEKEELKKDVWIKLIKERKIGYFALLRNLRNILDQAPEVVPDACELLTDEKLIKKSLVLPFRFLTASQEIQDLSSREAREIIIAISKALDISVNNVPKFDGDTLVAIDGSGSMRGKPSEIASLFGAVLAKSNNADVIVFDDSAKYKSINPLDSTITIASSFGFHFGGTDFDTIFDTANRKYDRIIILSDMQAWMGYNTPKASFSDYKNRTGANPKIYSFDLAGYGTLQFPEENIYCLAGFSEKVFDIMKLIESDKQALINEIEKIDL